MKRILIAVFGIILLLTAVGCIPTVQTDGSGTAPADEPAAAAAQSNDVQSYERRTAVVSRTFLDTLNAGKEIGVAADDLPPIIEMSAAATPAVAASLPNAAPAAAEPRFRIQILASGQIDMVRREQQKAESATNHPVIMVNEQALFKLYVGDFNTKAEAEAALPKIKADYPDAWIVNK